MSNSLENIYALLWIFARNRPSTVKRRSENKKNQRKTVEIQHTKLDKLRSDLFILNAGIVHY